MKAPNNKKAMEEASIAFLICGLSCVQKRDKDWMIGLFPSKVATIFSDQPEKDEGKELFIGIKMGAEPNRYSCNGTKRLPRIQQNICGLGQPS